MNAIHCLFEEHVAEFQPLVHLRPVFDLACGALTLRQKWERQLGGRPAKILVRAGLHEFRERPDHLAPADLARGVWLINGRALPSAAAATALSKRPRGPLVLGSGGEVIAAWFPPGASITPFDIAPGGIPDFS